jgi:hypothetical protein
MPFDSFKLIKERSQPALTLAGLVIVLRRRDGASRNCREPVSWRPMRAPTSRLECSGGVPRAGCGRNGKLRERLEKDQDRRVSFGRVVSATA